MYVEVDGRAKALDQRDGAAVGFLRLKPCLAKQVARNHAAQHLKHRRHQLGLCGQQLAQRNGQRKHPPAYGHMRDDVVHQVRRRLRHAELRQAGADCVFGLGEESRGVLLNQAVQRGLLGAVALVMNRGAIRRPLGLPANGLHARLPTW